jgi:2-methylcitrate dehydratase PrpD
MSHFKPTHTGPEPDPNDLSHFLSERAANMTFDDLSEWDIDAAKRSLLDTLGVSMAASTKAPKAVDPTRAYMHAYSSTGPAPCLTLGQRAHPLDAVFWLGALSHALDYDDVAGYCHPSAPVIAAVLPLLSTGEVTNGRKLLVAIALGQDLVIRMAQSLHKPVSDHGWLHSLPGVYGAAIASAKMLNLNARQIRSGLGLALHQTSGTMQALARPGSDFRGIREGLSARAGVMAAQLASKGMAGDPECLEGQYGFFHQYCNGEYDAAFTRQPQLMGSLITYKPWPCAGHPQLFLTALNELLERNQVSTDAIAAIRITGCSALLPHQCEPIEQRAAPSHSIDAKVSLPFLIGKIVKQRNLTIDDFSEAGLQDAHAIAIGRRVTWQLDPSLERDTNGYGIGVVEIDLEGGKTLRHQTEFPLGHPQNPLSWEQLVGKFRRCVEACDAAIAPSAVDTLVDQIANLERLSDAGVMVESFFEAMK